MLARGHDAPGAGFAQAADQAQAEADVRALAVDEDDDVGILFDRVVRDDAVGDEVVRARHRGIEHRLHAERLDGADGVPEQVGLRESMQLRVRECRRDAHEPLTARRALVEG